MCRFACRLVWLIHSPESDFTLQLGIKTLDSVLHLASVYIVVLTNTVILLKVLSKGNTVYWQGDGPLWIRAIGWTDVNTLILDTTAQKQKENVFSNSTGKEYLL